jgi:acetyl esterase/lipase
VTTIPKNALELDRFKNEERNPPFTLPDNVDMRLDVVYGQGGGRDLRADLFLPNDVQGPVPAIVFIHGGGWRNGTKAGHDRQASLLASRGYAGICIEYRLSGEAIFPAAVHDCKCAIRWVRANAAEMNIDPERIAAAGGSAGGHLTGMLATTAGRDDLEGEGGNPGVPSAIQLAISLNGVFDMRPFGTIVPSAPVAENPIVLFLGGTPEQVPEAYEAASSILHVDENTPPCLVFHGTGDDVVPWKQSADFVEKVRSVGQDAEFALNEGGGHGFTMSPEFFHDTLDTMEAFLRKHFGG